MQVQQSPQTESASPQSAANDRDLQFTRTVLRDTEMVWDKLFRDAGGNYIQPKLVLFSGYTPTACGTGQSAMGPFYCPADTSVYIDLSFYQDMKTRLGGGGDFAQGYVIAHEVGHHVQNLTGTDEQVRRESQANPDEANELSVRVELQADCYAGVWARAVQDRFGVLEPGDVQDALNTAARIGDDALQQAQRGIVVPDSFTHGTSEQRQRWFYNGFNSGDPAACDTFGANAL